MIPVGVAHVRESGFRNSEKFGCGIPNLGIQLKESGIPTVLGIQNSSSIDKDWNPTPGIWNLRPGIQNPRLSWIS